MTATRFLIGIPRLGRFSQSASALSVLLLLASGWLSSPLEAQNYLTSTGIPGFAAAYPAEMGAVDAASGNLHLQVKLGGFRQRGSTQPLGAELLYDSHIWKPFNTGVGWVWQPAGGPFYVVQGNAVSIAPISGITLGTTTNPCNNDWVVTDVSGVQRYFKISTTQSGTQCTSGSAYAADSSGFLLKVLSTDTALQNYNAVYCAPDGTQFFFNTSNTNNPEIVAEDSNGNYLSQYIDPLLGTTSFIDTLGRTLLTPQGAGYNVSNSQLSTSVDNYSISTITIPVKTHFGQSGITECTSNCGIVVTKSITLPDNSTYTFHYDCDSTTGNPACNSPGSQIAYYGELTSMTLPTGQTVTYGYTNFTDAAANVGRWLISKTTGTSVWAYSPLVTANGGWKTTYSCASGSQADGCQQVTVTRPDGSKDIDVFALNNGAWPVTIQSYDTNGTTLLTTVTNTFDLSNACSLNSCNSHGSQYVRKTASLTTLPTPGSNITSKTAYGYDSPQTGNVTAVKEWTFQTGTASSAVFPTVPDRATYSTYATIGANNNINRPLTRTLCNSSGTDANCPGGGTTVSRTTVTYDSYGGSSGNCLAKLSLIIGIANHDDTVGCTNTTRGNPTQVTRWVSPTSSLSTNFTYDTTGQVLQQTDPAGNAVTYSYLDKFHKDAGTNGIGTNPPASFTPTTSTGSTITTNAYITSITDAVGTVNLEYYYGSGKLAVATDYNATSSYTHFLDGFDNISEGDRPISWDLFAYPSSTQYQTYSAVGDTAPSFSCSSCTQAQAVLDSLGRPTGLNLVNNSPQEIFQNTVYDALGRVSSSSHPNFGPSDPNNVSETTQYDGLGRTVAIVHPGGQAAHTAYGAAVTSLGGRTGTGFPVVTQDEAGHLLEFWFDGFGQIIEVAEPSSSSGLTSFRASNYTYDAAGNLTQVSGLSVRTYTYDGLGRLTQENTREAGTVTLSYLTSSGGLCSGDEQNACSKTDARGIITTYSYDALGRMIQRTHSDATGTYTYSYDQGTFGKGRLYKLTDHSGSETFTYDAEGRLTNLAKVIGATTYNLGYQYNTGGELVSLTYPSGRVVQYAHDPVGHLCAVAASATSCGSPTNPYLTISSQSYDAAGRVLSAAYGNGVVATTSYDPQRSELTSLTYAKGASILFGLNYVYQQATGTCPSGYTGNNGQIQCITDVVQPGRSASYTYDYLKRLATANTAGSTTYPAWGLSETYDAAGNRLAQTVTAGSGYSSSLSIKPDSNRITTAGFVYDASGNVLAEPSPWNTTYTYDGENCLTSYTGNGNSATYTCDGNQMRVQTVITGPAAVSTVRIYFASQVLAEYDNGAAVSSPTREYVYGEDRLATIVGSSGGSGGTITYEHHDHLSPRMFTDANGNDIAEQGHYPFGEEWYQSNTNTNWVFTSYERGRETGLQTGEDNALARSYASSLGRFQSPDPEEGDLADPQTWDRYTYCRNDPVNISDSSGSDWIDTLFTVVSDVFMVAFAVEDVVAIGDANLVATLEKSTGESAFDAQTGLVFNGAAASGIDVSASEAPPAAAATPRWLSFIKTGLDFAGLVPGISEFANAINFGISVYQGHYGEAAMYLLAEVAPGAQFLAKAGKAAEVAAEVTEGAEGVSHLVSTGNVTVYHAVEDGVTKYVGITSRFSERAGEHLLEKNIVIKPIEGLENLSRVDARSVEQVLIEHYGRVSEGTGALLNKINSISPTRNPELYESAIARGNELLKTVNFKF